MTDHGPLNRTALSQHGCWTRDQALAAGFSHAAIGRHVARGLWRRQHPGVFCAGASPPAWTTDVAASLLFLGIDDAVVARRSAARLWRLPGFEWCSDVDVLVTREHTPRPRDVSVKRTIHLPPHDVVEHSGFRTTSVTRTLHDLAAGTSTEVLLTAAAEGFRLGRTDPWRLLDSVRSRPGLPGNRRSRDVIARLDPRLAAP